jgi:hypothetical protein
MGTSESIRALRRANPRGNPAFPESVRAAAVAVAAQLDTAAVSVDVGAARSRARHRVARRPLLRVSAVGLSFAAVGAVAVVLTIGSPGGSGVEDAAAAVERAATATAASADQSGTAVVLITHGGEPWAGRTIRWNGEDIAISRESVAVAPEIPERAAKPGDTFRVVDGIMYGLHLDGTWVEMGSPDSIDPGSGTTPGETLTAVREDVGGVTLRRIVDAMTGLATRELADGSVVYGGSVPAGVIARESGFKDGELLRVLPFGYVANGEAADPAAPLDTAISVGADGIVREILVSWGAGATAWTYSVAYSQLGVTPAIVPPDDARPLRERTRVEAAVG